MANLTPLFLNNVSSTVQAGSSAIGSATATGINVATGDGALFGAIGTNQYIPAVIVDTSTTPETVKEYVWVTARSTDALTVTRQAEESSRYAASTTTIQAGYALAAVASRSGLGLWTPHGNSGNNARDRLMLAWTYDPSQIPAAAAGATLWSAGFVALQRIYIPASITVTSIWVLVKNGGAGLANCFVGLYDASGARLVASANQSTAFGTSGAKQVSVSSTSITGGQDVYVYGAYLIGSATTAPTMWGRASGDNNVLNVGLGSTIAAAGGIQCGYDSTSGQTSLAATITAANTTLNGSDIWMGLS